MLQTLAISFSLPLSLPPSSLPCCLSVLLLQRQAEFYRLSTRLQHCGCEHFRIVLTTKHHQHCCDMDLRTLNPHTSFLVIQCERHGRVTMDSSKEHLI